MISGIYILLVGMTQLTVSQSVAEEGSVLHLQPQFPQYIPLGSCPCDTVSNKCQVKCCCDLVRPLIVSVFILIFFLTLRAHIFWARLILLLLFRRYEQIDLPVTCKVGTPVGYSFFGLH